MGLPDLFTPMVRPVPRVGVVSDDDMARRAGKTLGGDEDVSLFEISNAGEAIRIINGATKKGAMVVIASETTPDLDKIVEAFLASTRDRVYKLVVITDKTETYGEGIEVISRENAQSVSLREMIRRIDAEKGGDRSIRPLL